MKIILYANEECEFRDRLQGRIINALPQVQVDLADSGQHLVKILSRPLHNISVLIVFISDAEDVGVLLSLKTLFEDIKLILIGGKRGDQVPKSSLRLEPLYTSHSETDFQDVISVLQRIEQKQMHLALSIK